MVRQRLLSVHPINICVSCLSRSEWATKSCWMKLSHFVWWSDDIAPPWWHARWRSGGICILLKYFHSLKYFSGVENISPWQSWYKSLCYLCPTVRDIRCWYICCFSFQSPHWFVCLLCIIETKYLWKTVEEGRTGNYLTWQQIRLSFWEKGWNDVSCGLICYTLFPRVNHRHFSKFNLFLDF